MNRREHAQARGLRARPEVLVDWGNRILATDVGHNRGAWDWPNSHNSEGGGVCSCCLWEGNGEIDASFHGHTGETGLRVFLYGEPQGA